MEKKRQIFEETLTQSFDSDKYLIFLREMLPDIEIIAPNKEMQPYNTFSAAIENYRHIANYTGEDKNKVAVFSVCLKNDKNLENARSMQRAFVKTLLESSNCDGALVAFHTKGDSDKWRLSLVRMDYEFSKGKISENLTPAKRYSYLVGKGEPCHTAQERLYQLFVSDNVAPSLDALEEAFSVEAVTKEFFDKYREKYLDLKEFLDGNEQFMAESKARGFDSEQFAKKLMGQIVFLYFIQKKGWLGVNAFPAKLTEREYKDSYFRRGPKAKELLPKVYKQKSDGLFYRDGQALLALSAEDEACLSTLVKGDAWGNGPKDFMRRIFEGCKKSGKNFFDDYLEPLFYTGLNQNRGDNAFFQPLHRRVPFLNGGLFEELDGYDWRNNDFCIPNELFSNVEKKGKREADGILDVFDRYNFTMAEDEPMEREVAIDPEMLGKVFENLLDVTDRKSKGAFYTPREIVHYMCQETIINYLSGKTGIPDEDIRKFILYGEYFRDEDAKKTLPVDKNGRVLREEEKSFVKYHLSFDKNKELEIPATIFSFKENVNRLQEIDDLLAGVKVVDLAVGSGAFPLGMLTEIVKARDTITSYMGIEMNSFQRMSLRSMRNIYRMKRETIKNSIFACDIEPSAVDITKLRLWLSLVIDNQIMNEENDELGHTTKPRELPNLDCNIICGNSLMDEFEGVKLITENSELNNISGKEQGTLYDLSLGKMINELIELQEKLYDEKERVEKESLKRQIQDIYDKIVMEQLQANPEIVDDYYKATQMPSKPFVLWQLYFPKVFRDNGGFDIVIGNPPYVGESGHKEMFRQVAATGFGEKYYQGKMDFFYFFFHKGLDLLHHDGECALITTNYYLTASGAHTLRKDFADRANIIRLVNFNELKIFPSAQGQHNIITFLKKNYQKDVQCCITNRKGNVTPNILNSIVHWNDEGTTYFIIQSDSLYDNNGNIEFHKEDMILQKMLSKKNYVINKKDVGGGIDILQEVVCDKHLKIDPTLIVGEGIFAVDNKEIEDLNFNDEEKKILKPYYTSEQIKKYLIVGLNHKWILYTNKTICSKIDTYPNVKAHLDKYRKIITSDNKPYGLHRPRVESQFKGIKILALRMTKEPSFTLAEIDTYVTRAYLTIKLNNLDYKYALGLFNSKLFYYWLFYKGKRKGKQLQIDQAQIVELPIFVPDKHSMDMIINKVNTLLRLLSNGENTMKIENEVDTLVYNLYGLSEKEISIVNIFVKEQRNQ